MSEDAPRGLYEAYPASWRRKRRSAHIDIWAASVTLDWLAALKPGSVDILDVGCGAVWLTDALTPFGPITGIDTALLHHPTIVRALARGEYAKDSALLPRYLTTGEPSATSRDGFSVALALGEPSLPGDFAQFCQDMAAVMRAGGWIVWNPPTHHAFNQTNEWQTCLGAAFSVVDVAHLTTPFDREAKHESEAMIMLARRN